MTLLSKAAALSTALAVALGATFAVAQDMKFFRIGTGGAGGTYFPIGGLIANAISAPPGSTPCDKGGSCGVPGLVAIAQSSNASVANVTAVESGQIESGLASADIVFQAYNGLAKFDKKFAKLRVIANLFPEHMHLVLPKGAKLGSIKELKGKRVGIFQAGSGTQVVVLELLKLYGITKADIQAAELNPQQSADRLADGQLDAFFIVGGMPLAAISQLAATKGIELYSFSDEERATFLKAVPYYYAADIPAKSYEGVGYVAKSVAVGAQWVVSSSVDEKLVYDITAALWNGNSRKLFDAGHSQAKNITLENALKAVGTPIHPGAAKYYKEKGLLK
ncbi:MAG TPA: TAXI family TRAP transporter solute-binding subunit [Hyphomicrobiaceae bacterium]|nr:TAXI family TRAP transporter solute-binding subunit [Hyphomicrobiaceae bacterium]